MPARVQYAVKDLPTATSPPRMPCPGPNYFWKAVPGRGDEWIEDSGGPWDWGVKADGSWGWVPKAAPTQAPPTRSGGDVPPTGVDPAKLTAEKRWWCNGERCSKEEAHALLSGAANLADDSGRWNLAVVGDPGFLRKVTDDVAKLSPDLTAKLHVKTYSLDAWQVGQFKLGPGVTLRKPAVGRVGADLGTLPVADYTPLALGELLSLPGGPNPTPNPKPKPPDVAPQPEPKKPDQPAPTPNVDPAPKPANPIPNPKPDHTPLLLLLLGGGLLWWLFRR